MPRRGGTGRTSRRLMVFRAKTRSREGGTVRSHASMTEPYELSNRTVDTGRPIEDQYAAGCLARA